MYTLCKLVFVTADDTVRMTCMVKLAADRNLTTNRLGTTSHPDPTPPRSASTRTPSVGQLIVFSGRTGQPSSVKLSLWHMLLARVVVLLVCV